MKKLKIKNNAPVVLGFAGISLAALIINTLTLGAANTLLFSSYHSSLLSPLTYVRMFTHVLGHSGWAHFLGNVSYLLLLGPMLEEKYGSKKILQVILLTAFVTGLVHYILFPHSGLCGASGVVFAFILLTSFTSFKNGEIPLSFILVALIYIGGQVVDGLTVKDNISNLSHIIGGVVGSMVGYQLNKKR